MLFRSAGYENEVVAVRQAVGVVPDVELRRGVAFEPYFRGSGRIVDVSTGDTVQLPLSRMIHVIVFPEGYRRSDLDDGRYERDLERWFEEVFALDVMEYLKDAFVIWKCPLPSREHLPSNGAAYTHFGLPVQGHAMGHRGYERAAHRTWELLDRFPFTPTRFSSPLHARNVVCSYMLYHPVYGRSGYSGLAMSFADPADASRRVCVAMAHDRQHEFMHALARLADEYYDRRQRPLSDNTLLPDSRFVTNVVSIPERGSLPWKHLLSDGEFNPGVDSLVGAFGKNGRYHSELKCLMNGVHHNADLYGGRGNLRTSTRLCNWCRELVFFRVYERCGLLPDPLTSYQQWVTEYRRGFYDAMGFSVPPRVPQRSREGRVWFEACR